MTESLFETASRRKFRYATPKGALNTEQLWDLELISERADVITLDSVARAVNKELKANTEESFVPTKVNTVKDELSLKLEVLKHIIAVKVAEREAAKRKQEDAVKRQKILEQLAKLDDREREGKSREQLMKELEELS